MFAIGSIIVPVVDGEPKVEVPAKLIATPEIAQVDPPSFPAPKVNNTHKVLCEIMNPDGTLYRFKFETLDINYLNKGYTWQMSGNVVYGSASVEVFSGHFLKTHTLTEDPSDFIRYRTLKGK